MAPHATSARTRSSPSSSSLGTPDGGFGADSTAANLGSTGVMAAGRAPRESPDPTELTLDRRFIRDFSPVTVLGDQGSTSVDGVWRMRS